MKKIIFLSIFFLSIINLYSQTNSVDKNISLVKENFQKENFDKAILFSMRCLAEEPNNVLALSFIQLSYHNLGKYEISNEYGNKILKLVDSITIPSNILTMVALHQGLNYAYLNDDETACSFLQMAVLIGEGRYLTIGQNQFILNNCYK
tara:strand:- start:32 stop:478 length:447 start_codon:yes stop_codon:yes gene_type:complete